ncbi:DUF6624 domain-containing protein [Micromonospora matsumotoense]|uniref:DUF6624 domain-containing protein n=1 Tax=Micromonospora matsumotoense TaxID=121616 RepID=UPI003D909F73
MTGATDPSLAAELVRRLHDDQEARRAWITTDDGAGRMLAADRDNARWLREVLCRHGWPGTGLVGTTGAEAAWMLAQHADHDVVFQRQCLELLIEAVDRGEAPRPHVAYLADRVLRKRGDLQRYGTQYRAGRSGLELCPSQEPWGLAERRAAMGLPAADTVPPG